MKKVLVLVFAIVFLLVFTVGTVESAHFIIGRVNDAIDGTSSNDLTVVLWNSTTGFSDNLTDTIGPNGNSGQDNLYMIDCELLLTPCQIGDIVSIQVLDDNSSEYFTATEVNVTISDAGFDLAANLTLNSPPNISSILVEDSLLSPADEIDLVAASTRQVNCTANITELDSDSLQNIESRFFLSSYDFDTTSDNNYHYTNDSCYVDSGFGGANDSQITCSFDVEYYSDSGSWTCQVRLEDEHSSSRNDTDATTMNELLAIGVLDSVDFGLVEILEVSNESTLNVTNYGNVQINLSLSGYGSVEEDGYSMDCLGGAIDVNYMKYNLTASNSSNLSLGQFESLYSNLSSIPVVRQFDLDYRQNDLVNDMINSTFWRVYVPDTVGGTCNGSIVFGAVKAAGT